MEQDRISQVRERAHAIWLEQGQPEGAADQHWAQAEAEFDAAEASATITPADDATAEPEPASQPAASAEPAGAATPEPAEDAPAKPAKKPVKRRVKPLTPIR